MFHLEMRRTPRLLNLQNDIVNSQTSQISEPMPTAAVEVPKHFLDGSAQNHRQGLIMSLKPN